MNTWEKTPVCSRSQVSRFNLQPIRRSAGKVNHTPSRRRLSVPAWRGRQNGAGAFVFRCTHSPPGTPDMFCLPAGLRHLP
ncbi:hypothetical protein SKAU_G00420580 [Synaphobranchus kaupii]|uniref:Uncharacterized protein n=1 Tax=Synaphobranchus kaupii TaxID=118154 RepID=A0A9Q1E6K5_SYNKA|nr:hypothetical protein SKAU_G00420580 [Synaphobranchus kaupii]